MYKNIVFDIGNVLTYWNTYDLVYSFCLNDKDTKIIISTLMVNWARLMDGKTSDEEVYNDTIKMVPLYLHSIVRMIIDSYFTHFVEVAGMKDLIKELKETKHHIYCISNAPASLARNIEALPILNGFEGIVISGDVNMVKPNSDIYQYFLNKYKLFANDCLFIDDVKANIVGCEKVGIKGHVFSDCNELKQYLIEINELFI